MLEIILYHGSILAISKNDGTDEAGDCRAAYAIAGFLPL
jgi:hypothetical protein